MSSKPYLVEGNLLKRFFFFYTYKVLKKGNEKIFEPSDLYRLKDEDKFEHEFKQFYDYYIIKKEKQWSYEKIIWRYIFPRLFQFIVLLLLAELCTLVFPFAVKRLINWFDNDTADSKEAYLIVLIVFVLSIIKTCFNEHGYKVSNYMLNALEIIFYGLYFNKMEKISLTSKQRMDISKISNSVTSDVMKVAQILRKFRIVFITPLTISFYIFLLFKEIGVIAFAGIIFLFIFVLFQFRTGRIIAGFTEKKARTMDKRVTLTTNALTGVKTIKFNAWEDVILRRIDDLRRKETRFAFLKIFTLAILDNLSSTVPMLCSLICIIIYMLQVDESERSLGTLFFVIFTFKMLKTATTELAQYIKSKASGKIAFKRLKETLSLPNQEEHNDVKTDDKSLGLGECLIENGDFTYDQIEEDNKDDNDAYEPLLNLNKSLNLVLNEINLHVKPGEFVAIVGRVGCGKTSLLRSLCRTLTQVKGKLSKHGKIGYIPQKAFLLNMTLRDNILFGTEFNSDNYAKVIKYSELIPDIDVMVSGDSTEIGERGINLSGGQKQRINIARAVYADCDIYLIDDSLSALDAYVGQNIFKNVFNGLIKNKTRIMTTHALQYLKQVDRVVYMEEGRIIDQGTYKELKRRNKSFVNFVRQEEIANRKEALSVSVSIIEPSFIDKNESFTSTKKTLFKKIDDEKGVLTRKEKRFRGDISFKLYIDYYLKSGSCFFLVNIIILFIFILSQFFADYWISLWSRRSLDLSDFQYIKIYLLITLVTIVFIFISGFVWSKNFSFNAHRIYNELIKKIMNKKMSFFDRTPSGQIINLSSSDTNIMDAVVPGTKRILFSKLLNLLGTVLLIVTGNFILLGLFILMTLVFAYFLRLYLKTVIEVRRLEQLVLSPILSNLQELYNGLVMFRSLDKFDFIRNSFIARINLKNNFVLTRNLSLRLLNFIIETLVASFVAISLSMLIAGKTHQWSFVLNNTELMAVTVGMSISLASQIGLLILNFGLVETYMSNIQRLLYNIDDEDLEDAKEGINISESWPERGSIKAVNVNARYRKDLPLVLNNVNFDIKGGERVGIIGRTGSGKSSLILAFTRLLDLEDSTSYFEVDGFRTDMINLNKFRKTVSVIPQDPFLLKGTLQFNIDPYGKAKREEVIDVLKKSFIWDSSIFTKIDGSNEETSLLSPKIPLSAEEKLSFEIEDGGKNFSVGERQLICIARALLDKPRILLMDEATSNIDPNTDHLLQQTIKEKFKGSTILTIAHRLDTIVDYDRILVFDNACLVEQGSLRELMSGQTLFKEIVKENGSGLYTKISRLLNQKTK